MFGVMIELQDIFATEGLANPMDCNGLSLLVLLPVLLFPQARAAVVIDFDSLNDGDIITTQFSGVTFQNTIALTAGISLNEFEFPPHSGSNVVSDNGGPITIAFDTPVLSFSGYFTYLVPLTLTAFDTGNSQAGQAVSLFNSNMALSGDPGSSPNELLSVAFASGISSVSITGDPLGGSFTLDDATFDPAAAEVPEPGSLSFLTAGGLLLALRRRKPKQ
jgi:hypothetical protein